MAAAPRTTEHAPRRNGGRGKAAQQPRGAWRRLKGLIAGFAWRRWLAVWVCVAVLLVGIPLAHAMVGDLGALLLLAGVGGFALGRSTAPQRGVMRTGKARSAAPPRQGAKSGR
ncbi:hypothetical protein CR162_03490 [Pseudoroseomonas rhizosphaerae]|uniref:Uncharacterized protein n=1 Tax=Teichococcus rhizosphaerae TaxID=1335062 RepID=A0A2C7AGS5_9PROT|nr:hypothetical protein [Pseudoroseomonas rhizosphaerae]PHK96406.1 hypothetical protein CR162_03490 [Pseudoroseomonas rhizosphaerae]